MKNIIMKDQAVKDWRTDHTCRRVDSGIAYNLMTLVMLLSTIFILFAISQAASAKTNICYAIDHEQAEHIIGDDMEEYIPKYAHGKRLRLGEFQ